ncbi:MAG: hypothetical protein IPI58_04005 [Alphaproteobacteria bacterium]|nr:MAG: hypothetical protein IPI58_04005 [Alphaproteobacteria bacterium]
MPVFQIRGMRGATIVLLGVLATGCEPPSWVPIVESPGITGARHLNIMESEGLLHPSPLPVFRLSPTPPPSPLVEAFPGYVPPYMAWRVGHWEWSEQGYVWQTGQWVKRPHPTAVLVPDRWYPHKFGWAFASAYWQ